MANIKITRQQTGNNTGSMSHEIRVQFIDNSQAVLAQMNANCSRALNAVGVAGVGMIVEKMQSGYSRRIWETGDLQRDVSYLVHQQEKAVDFGNTLEYSLFVHDGTRKMAARPYIRDGLTDPANQNELKAIYEAYLKQGFGK